MPNRMLRVEALTSRKLHSASFGAEVLYYRLMLVADDWGRFHADPLIVRSTCFPLAKATPKQVDGWLLELDRLGAIHVYDVGTDAYLEFDRWPQRTDKRTDSRFPGPASGTFREVPGKSRSDGDGDGDGKPLERGESPRPRQRNKLVDALARVEGSNPNELTRSHARALGVAVAEIKRATPSVSPDEIERRASIYQRKHPDWELTGPALAKHWAAVASANGRNRGAAEREL